MLDDVAVLDLHGLDDLIGLDQWRHPVSVARTPG
jgi:hypothetical protein